MSTPGRRRALRALAAKRRANKQRYLRGEKTAIVGGKKISFSTFFKKIGGKPANWKKKKAK